VTRFRTYGVELTGACADYAQAILTMPTMLEWEEAARAESWRIAASEVD
jgi:glutathione S-transferase